MTVVVASNGQRLTLGPLIGKGGEGSVHQVVEVPDLAAKIYHGSNKAKERYDKIFAMVQAGLHGKSDLVAYPRDTLRSTNGEFVGFTMNKVSGFKSVHDLYGPGSRKVEFPAADSTFLVRAAINLAAAIASVHANGCVIGDINHSGILVSDKALITLIDSDSFQYRGPNAIYRCLVGTREYTPPELQGTSFQVDRTPNHDNFGLAILVFQLLFLGRHPFSGRYQGTGDMDIATAIRDGRFAYSARRAETMMEPPPHVPALSDYGEDIRKAFETAFMPPARQPSGRPQASEWLQILRSHEASLQICKVEKAHAYRPGLANCPWCLLERGMGRSLFAAQYTVTSSLMDIGQLLASIRGIPSPSTPPQAETVIPSLPEFQISAEGQAARKERKITMIAGIAAMAVGLYLITAVQGFWGLLLLVGSAVVTMRGINLKVRLAAEHSAAQSHWNDQVANWLQEAGPEKFERRKKHYLDVVNTHSGLPAKERQRLDALEQQKRQLQLVKHMESHLIDRAKIKGIGPGRKATLASFGFENAWDVLQQNITIIPGFGPALASDLLSWARTIERKFVFNASAPTDPRAIQDVKTSIARERAELERELVNGPLELRRIADDATAVRRTPPQPMIDAYVRLKQVERDMRL